MVLGGQFHLPFSTGGGYGGLIASSRLQGGHEITASYGATTNANLLATYGFVLGFTHLHTPLKQLDPHRLDPHLLLDKVP